MSNSGLGTSQHPIARVSVPSSEKTLRDLDSFEEFFFYLEEISPSLHCQMVRLIGATSAEQWFSAWEKLHAHHPLLYTRLQKDAGQRPRFVRATESAPISVERLSWQNELTALIESALAHPFSYKRAPLVRAQVFKGPSECLVLLSAHHSLYDGMGLMLLLQDLLRIVGGVSKLSTVGHWISLRDAIGAPRRGDYEEILSDGAWDEQVEGPPVARVQVQHLQLSRELTSQIESRTRIEGTTPHGALMAALQLAGGKSRSAWLTQGLHCNTPHDVRRSIADESGLPGMLTVPLITFLRPVADRSFWDMAREYRDDLTAARSPEAKRAFIKAMDGLTVKEYTPTTFLETLAKSPIQYELMITDYAGYRPAVEYGDLRLEAIATGNNGGAPHTQTIGVCTLRGSMNLTHFSVQPIEGFLEDTRNLLSEVVA